MTAYAAASGQGDDVAVPTVDTYTTAGVAGVTADNLDAVNAAVAAADRDDADTLAEVQAIATRAIDGADGNTDGDGTDGVDPSPDGGDPDTDGGDPDTDGGDPDTDGGDPDTGDGTDGVDPVDPAATALAVISAYAAANGQGDDVFVPTVDTYVDAGVTGVTESNLAAVNSVLALTDRDAADETVEVQGLVDGAIADLADAARRTALSQLQFHAQVSGAAGTDPSLETYADAGVSGVTAANLAAVNGAIASASGLPAVQAAIAAADGDADAAAAPDFAAAAAEIQALADPAIAAVAATNAALEVISAWADADGGGTAPSVVDYTTAGVTGVTEANLDAVNAAVAAVAREAADETSEVQALADGVIAAVAASLLTIADYAADSANQEPTAADYEAVLGLGIGVTADNLAAVNAAIAAVEREAADTVDEIFGLVQDAVAGAALDVIADYAADATNTTPTVADYQAVVGLGIGVTADNLAAVNAAVSAVERDAADTADEVFALAQVAVAADAALDVIADYAADSANSTPTVANYEAALNVVDLVTDSNLAAVNASIAAVEREAADTVEEILGLVQDAVAGAALDVIANYAADEANTAPTVDDYGYALDNFSLVTDANLEAVNSAVAAVAREAADTVDEILGLVQDVVADAALDVIANYAADEANTAPTVDDYGYALDNFSLVTAANLEAVNSAVAAVEREAADTVDEIADIVTDAVAGAALDVIANYAADEANTAPTVNDYGYALDDFSLVTATNLAAANASIAAVEREAADTAEEIADIVTDAVADAALDVIANYAADEANPAPTVADYGYALNDFSLVTDANLAAANAAIAAVEREAADTVEEIFGLVRGVIAAPAIEVIANYAADSDANTAPTVADYEDALGVFDFVTDANLADVNAAIAAVEREAADTVEEIFGLVRGVVAGPALNVIANYAADSDANTAPTVDTYVDAGVAGVTESNFAAVNAAIVSASGLPAVQAAIAAADGDPDAAADPDFAAAAAEIQALADPVIAVGVIADWAEDSTDPSLAPSLETYTSAGVTGVTADNLAAVNAAVAAEDRGDADTLAEVQAIAAAYDVDGRLILTGTTGNDISTNEEFGGNGMPLIGTAGNDVIRGLAGNDDLRGGAGDDILEGGLGEDFLRGGDGRDVFTFRPVTGAPSTDRILDFNPSEDRLEFVGFDRGSLDALRQSEQADDGIFLVPASDDPDELSFRTSGHLFSLPNSDSIWFGLTDSDDLTDDNVRFYTESGERQWVGTAEDDELGGTAEDDRLQGLQGADRFIFNALLAGGDDVIADFDPDADVLVIRNVDDGISSVADLRQRATVEDGNLVITLSNVRITLEGLDDADDLTGTNVELLAIDPVEAALVVISAYAADDTGNPAPTVQDYAAAGVTGVTDANLAAMNLAVAAVDGSAADTTAEVQAISAAVALTVISSYATDATDNPAPLLETYATAGVTGVTESNLAAVNAVLALADRDAANETVEVQGLVDGAIADLADAARRTALSELQFHAQFSGAAGTDPSLETGVIPIWRRFCAANSILQIMLRAHLARPLFGCHLRILVASIGRRGSGAVPWRSMLYRSVRI